MSASHTPHKNGSFASSIGFVLACVGSAVGMGNIWLFPYRLGQYGGAAFLIPYLLFVALFGYVGLSAEFAIGRRVGTGTLGVYSYCFAHRGKKRLGDVLGWIPLFGSLGIAIGYAVIVGWVLRSLFHSLSGTMLTTDSTLLFGEMSSSFGNLPFHTAVIVIAVLILLFGATNGIEKANKVMMPLFYLLFLVLAIRSALLSGAAGGYEFLFVPDWSALLNPFTWVMAMGQAFFSLSITGSGMMVYGSYLSRSENIPKASLQTAFFDTLAALLSALVIMPAVFHFGIAPESGPSLMFITLPKVFAQLPFSRLLASFFFLSVLFAGITSLMNMFEAVTESLQHRFHFSRRKATLLCGAIALFVGIFFESGDAVGHLMDFISIVVVPFGALLGAITIYYVYGFRNIESELLIGREKPLSKAFPILSQYIYVPLTILVFLLGLLVDGGIG